MTESDRVAFTALHRAVFLVLSAAMAAIFAFSCLVLGFRRDSILETAIPASLIVAAIVYAPLLIYYLYDWNSARSGFKIVYSGVITGIQAGPSDDEEPRKFINIGNERLEIFAADAPADLGVGQVVSVHYFQRRDLRPGRLLRFERGVPDGALKPLEKHLPSG